MEEKKKEYVFNREFYELNGLKTFIKFKSNSFGIGKALLAFVEFDTNTKKMVKSIDVYIDIPKMLVFCNDCLSGKLPKEAAAAAKKNPKFPPAVYQVLGGFDKDGKTYSRTLKFGASSKEGNFCFQAELAPGKRDEKGLIQSTGKFESRIIVPCSKDNLKELCLVFQTEYNAWLSSCYMKAEKSKFKK